MELAFAVEGMTCNSCRLNVVEEVEELEGVTSVDVDLATGRTTISGEALDEASIQLAITAAGYRSTPLG